MKDEVHLLPTYKHQRFLQISSIILCVCGQDEVDFLHADKYDSLLQIDTITLVGMVNHSQSSQDSKFATS